MTLSAQLSQFPLQRIEGSFRSGAVGSESELLDQMFQGINIAGTGLTGAVQRRRATARTIRNNLANGNYPALATAFRR